MLHELARTQVQLLGKLWGVMPDRAVSTSSLAYFLQCDSPSGRRSLRQRLAALAQRGMLVASRTARRGGLCWELTQLGRTTAKWAAGGASSPGPEENSAAATDRPAGEGDSPGPGAGEGGAA